MTKVASKQTLYVVAVIASTLAAVTPNCAAFTLLPGTSQVSTRNVQPSSYDMAPTAPRPVDSTTLSAFRFPSQIEKQEQAPLVEEGGVLTSLVEPITDVCILALRLSTCALMIHHGLDKIQNVNGFSANVVAKFFGFLPGDPSFWTLSAAATQVGGSALLAVGVLSRPVAFSMMMTMVVAVVFHLLNTGLEGFPLAVVSQHSYNYELASMYVGVLAYFSASGAGAYSVDEQLLGGELELYDSLLGKVLNKFDGEMEELEAEEVVAEKNSFKLPW